MVKHGKVSSTFISNIGAFMITDETYWPELRRFHKGIKITQSQVNDCIYSNKKAIAAQIPAQLLGLHKQYFNLINKRYSADGVQVYDMVIVFDLYSDSARKMLSHALNWLQKTLKNEPPIIYTSSCIDSHNFVALLTDTKNIQQLKTILERVFQWVLQQTSHHDITQYYGFAFPEAAEQINFNSKAQNLKSMVQNIGTSNKTCNSKIVISRVLNNVIVFTQYAKLERVIWRALLQKFATNYAV